jgi:hypothetical protein
MTIETAAAGRTIRRCGLPAQVSFLACALLMVGCPHSSAAPAQIVSGAEQVTSERALADVLDPGANRPLTQAANRAQMIFAKAVFGEELTDYVTKGGTPKSLELQSEADQAFHPLNALMEKNKRSQLDSLLRRFTWAIPCAHALEHEAAKANPDLSRAIPGCRSNQHPNPLVPLMLVSRALETVDDDQARQQALADLPKINSALRKSVAPFAAKRGVTLPMAQKGLDPEKQFYLEFSPYISKVQDDLANDPAQAQLEQRVSRLQSPRQDDDLSVDQSSREALLKSVVELRDLANETPALKICGRELSSNDAIPSATAATFFQSRLKDVVLPSLEEGLRIVAADARGGEIRRVKSVAVDVDLSVRTANSRSPEGDTIIVGLELRAMCKSVLGDLEPQVGKLNDLAEAAGKAGVTDKALFQIVVGGSSQIIQIIDVARSIDRDNESFLESVDFILAHELAHLSMDGSSIGPKTISPKNVELRADMLAAATVDAAHPSEALARVMASMAPSSSSSVSSGGAESQAQAVASPGAEALFRLVSAAGYESQRPGDHPPLKERLDQLDDAMYRMDYWQWTKSSH